MNAQTGNISQTFHLYLPDLTCETEKNPFTRVGHTYTFARFSFHLSRITSCGRKKITSITRNRHFTFSRAWLNDSKACLFDRNVLWGITNSRRTSHGRTLSVFGWELNKSFQKRRKTLSNNWKIKKRDFQRELIKEHFRLIHKDAFDKTIDIRKINGTKTWFQRIPLAVLLVESRKRTSIASQCRFGKWLPEVYSIKCFTPIWCKIFFPLK